MNEMIEYLNNNITLSDKEKYLFNNLQELYNNCCILFSEMIDIKGEKLSEEELRQIYIKYIKLHIKYIITNEEIEKIKVCCSTNYSYIAQKFLFKLFLSCSVTVLAFCSNFFLGIVSFVTLNKKAISDFGKELAELIDIIYEYDFESNLNEVKIMLENCYRIIEYVSKNNELEVEMLTLKIDK